MTARETALITGAGGLLGATLVLEWVNRFRVVAVAHERRLRWPGVEVIHGDLLQGAALARAIVQARPQLVVHAAAWTDVDGCERDPERARALHVDGSRWVASAAAAAGAACVYISTDAVFDGGRGDYAETDVPAPVNAYARSKLAGEQAVREAHPQALILRVPPEGWRPAGRPAFVQWLVGRLRRGERVPVCTDWRRNPALAADLAGVLAELHERGCRGLYHAGAEAGMSNLDVARAAAEVFGLDAGLLVPVTGDSLGLSARRPRNTVLETQKLRRTIRTRVRDIRESLEAMREEERHGRLQQLRVFVGEAPRGAPAAREGAALAGRSVVFRCDGSATIGLGHVIRCLTLAEALGRAGAGPMTFVTRAYSGTVLDKIAAAGFAVRALPPALDTPEDLRETCAAAHRLSAGRGPALVVTDSHEFPASFYAGLKAAGLQVLSIDDTGGPAYASDVVLNHNVTAARYRFEVTPTTQLLLGPAYVPLRGAFRRPRRARDVAAGLRQLVVSLGGIPAVRDYERVIAGIERFAATRPQLQVLLALGVQDGAADLGRLARLPDRYRLAFDGEDLGARFAEADAAIVSGGLIAYEAASVGVPLIMVSLDTNQDDTVAGFAQAGACLALGRLAAAAAADIEQALRRVSAQPRLRQQLAAGARALVDGQGVSRIIDVLARLPDGPGERAGTEERELTAGAHRGSR